MRPKFRRWLTISLRVIGMVLIVAYLAATASLADNSARNRLFSGVIVNVNDTARLRFVTPREIGNELGALPRMSGRLMLRDIDTDSLERMFSLSDKVERAAVMKLTNGKIYIDVTPMLPVARIYEGDRSYYINKDGKKIMADARYFVDVPVIAANFTDTIFTPRDLLPLLEYINADSLWNTVVTMIKVDSPRDVILVPSIRGHVVNFGAPTDFDSKFKRLHTMYTRVLPAKGWDYYDTISVKWRGQVVATRRIKPQQAPRFEDEEDEEETTLDTMMGEDTAPGQAIPGQPAKAEPLIPAMKMASQQTDKTKN